jgi:hypothetical protein
MKGKAAVEHKIKNGQQIVKVKAATQPALKEGTRKW